VAYDASPHLAAHASAVIVFECQDAIIGPGTPLAGLRQDVLARRMIENLREVLAAARESGVFIVYCNMAFRPDHLGAPNTPRYDQLPKGPPGPGSASPVVAELAPAPEDFIIERLHGMSSFYGTPLEPVLRERGVTTVVPTGVSLNIGIISTTVEALNRGYRVVVARDCVAGDPSSYADAVLRNTLNNLAYLSNSEEICALWRSATGSRTGS